MARKATYAQITKALADAAECYNKAANGVQGELKEHLTNKWALIRQISIIVASRNEGAMNDFLDQAKGWQRDGEACAAERAK